MLVPFPFSDLSTTKVRPAVVVSGQHYHSARPDLILAALTSNTRGTSPVDYLLRDWVAAGLVKPTAFKPVLFTIDPRRILYQVGVLTRPDLEEIDRRLRLMLDL